MEPGFAAVVREVEAAVVAEDHVPRVGRVDPKVVHIEVKDAGAVRQQVHQRALDLPIGTAAVFRDHEPVAGEVDDVLVVGRDPDDTEVVAGGQPFLVHFAPRGAAIVGAVKLAADSLGPPPTPPTTTTLSRYRLGWQRPVVVDQCVDHGGVGGRHVDGDTADVGAGR